MKLAATLVARRFRRAENLGNEVEVSVLSGGGGELRGIN